MLLYKQENKKMFKHAASVEEAFVNEQLFKRHCANPDLVPMRRRVLTELSEEEKKNLITNNALYHMTREELIAYGLEYNLQVPSIYLANPGTYITLMISAYSIFADKMNSTVQFKPTLSSWSGDLTAQERLQIIAAYNSNSVGAPIAVIPPQNVGPVRIVGTPAVPVGTPVAGNTNPQAGRTGGGGSNSQTDRTGGRRQLDMQPDGTPVKRGTEEEKGSGAGVGMTPERLEEIRESALERIKERSRKVDRR